MRKAIFILVCIAFCMGQTCGVPAASNPQGILPGIYVGSETEGIKITVTDSTGQIQTASDTQTSTQIREFGVDGLPLTNSGTPVQPGDSKTLQMGPFLLNGMVNSASASGNRAYVQSTVSMRFTLQNESVLLTGAEFETYTQVDDNSISIDGSMTVSGCDAENACATLVFTSTGTLTK
jgi:hypothetical protein